MALEILEIHHHAVRIASGDASMKDNLAFYSGVLGLGVDQGRPNIPGLPGYWLNVGDSGQIHLIACDGPSPLAKSPSQDPTATHVAMAVADVFAAKAELDRMGVTYWSMKGVAGPEFEQIFMNDPSGNLVEVHQIGACRCQASSR